MSSSKRVQLLVSKLGEKYFNLGHALELRFEAKRLLHLSTRGTTGGIPVVDLSNDAACSAEGIPVAGLSNDAACSAVGISIACLSNDANCSTPVAGFFNDAGCSCVTTVEGESVGSEPLLVAVTESGLESDEGKEPHIDPESLEDDSSSLEASVSSELDEIIERANFRIEATLSRHGRGFV